MESYTSEIQNLSITASPVDRDNHYFNLTDNNFIPTATSYLKDFSHEYRPIHGILSPVICVLGIIANCLNIVVLTRKSMLSSTNVLLTWLAIADGLTMLVYLPFAILNYHVFRLGVPPSPYANAAYTMFFALFGVVIHSVSIWLTVSLAVFRYVFIRFPSEGLRLCSVGRARMAVALVCLVVTVVCVPNFVSCTVRNVQIDSSSSNSNNNSDNSSNSEILWYVTVRDDSQGYRILKSFNLWIQAFLLKLVPCALLAVLNLLLIKQMKHAGKRLQKQLKKKSAGGGGGSKPEHATLRRRKTNRTTRMLVVVVVILVLTETPHGVLMLLGGIIDGFFETVYTPLGDLIDTLALFNSGVNFVLYCTMSKQFQATFLRIFLCDTITIASNGRYSVRSVASLTKSKRLSQT